MLTEKFFSLEDTFFENYRGGGGGGGYQIDPP